MLWLTIYKVVVLSEVLGPAGSGAMVRPNIVVGKRGRGSPQRGPGTERDKGDRNRMPQGPAPNN